MGQARQTKKDRSPKPVFFRLLHFFVLHIPIKTGESVHYPVISIPDLLGAVYLSQFFTQVRNEIR
jgi:hypothetical protein